MRWRAEHEKIGYEHRTPVTSKALAALEEARRHNPGIGDTPLLPAPKDPFPCMSRALARDWPARLGLPVQGQAVPGRDPIARHPLHARLRGRARVPV